MDSTQTPSPTKTPQKGGFGVLPKNNLSRSNSTTTSYTMPKPKENSSKPNLFSAQHNSTSKAPPKLPAILKKPSPVSTPQLDPDPATQSGQINIECDTPEAKKKIIMEEIPMSNVDFSRLFPK